MSAWCSAAAACCGGPPATSRAATASNSGTWSTCTPSRRPGHRRPRQRRVSTALGPHHEARPAQWSASGLAARRRSPMRSCSTSGPGILRACCSPPARSSGCRRPTRATPPTVGATPHHPVKRERSWPFPIRRPEDLPDVRSSQPVQNRLKVSPRLPILLNMSIEGAIGSRTVRVKIPAWAAFGLLIALLSAVYLAAPLLGWRAAFVQYAYSTVAAVAATAIFVGVHRNRPSARRAWMLIGAGQGIFAIGDAIYVTQYSMLGSQ